MAVPAALTKAQAAEGDIDVNELVFGHIGDAYQWHIAKFGDTEVSIPLPVIVKSSTGWHVFSSARLEEGPYEGLYVAEGGAYDGKIVERNAAGEEVRPLDISITKNVLGLFINSAVLLVIMMSCVRWYKKHPLEDGAPKGGVGMIEATVLSIYNDVIKGCIGENYRRYAPYLLTAFFFVLVNNLMGLIPIFPGGANVTGNIAITLVLALCTFVLTNVYGTKAYWKEIFWPDVPTWLKAPIPMMPLIEFFGIFTKPFALMIRLFANIMAGHAAVLSLVAIIFITVKSGPVINGSMTVVSVAFSIFMDALEILVAFIQAYVFTMLSAVFIGLSQVKEHAEKLIQLLLTPKYSLKIAQTGLYPSAPYEDKAESASPVDAQELLNGTPCVNAFLLNRYKDAIAEEAARALSGDSGANEAIVKRYGELFD